MRKAQTKKKSWMAKVNQALDNQHGLKNIILLSIRLYLAPLFLLPGWQQLNHFDQTVIFFGDNLQLPYPFAIAILAIGVQLLASCTLLIGFLTRWSALLLAIFMAVIIFTVQIENGWYYIIEYNLHINQIISLLQKHGDYDQLIQQGEIALIANGIELSVIYLLTLLTLFSYGGGKISIDSRLWGK